MPRSLPGPRTLRLSRKIAPSVGSIRPATSRSKLVLPQPDGPTITENSLSSTSSEMFSSAVTGAPPLGIKRSATFSMCSFGVCRKLQHPVAQPGRLLHETQCSIEVEVHIDRVQMRIWRRLRKQLERQPVAGIVGIQQ